MTTTLAPIGVRAAAPEVAPVPGPEHGLTWRGATPADAPALFTLIDAVDTADAAPSRWALVEVEEMFAPSWVDPARDMLVGLAPDGTAAAWAFARSGPGDTTVVRAFLQGGVHPDWRRRGIGTALRTWLEARGRQLLAASGKELPARLATFVDDSDAGTIALYRAGGFGPLRYYSDMRRSLAQPLPQARAVPGVRLVPWSPELDDAVRLAHNEAFADHWGSEPRTAQEWSEHRSMFAPSWSVVALDETTGEVAGYALSGRFEQDWAVAGYTSGYTDLLGVRRAWRGRGVAVALLTATMAAYAADGMEYAELGVDTENPSGAHGLYAALGYAKVHGTTLLGIDL